MRRARLLVVASTLAGASIVGVLAVRAPGRNVPDATPSAARGAGAELRASRPRARAAAADDAAFEADPSADACTAAADSPRVRNDVPPHRGGWISGRVAGPDGAPLHHARVACHPDPVGAAGESQGTDETGAFSDWVNTPAGVVRTIAWGDGFAVRVGEWHEFRRRAEADVELDVGTIRLAPAAEISGTVVGRDGEPRPGATVRVVATDAIPFEDWRLVEEWTWLDEPGADRETGEFRLGSFPAGTYRLRAESEDGEVRSDEVTVVAPATGVRLVLPSIPPARPAGAETAPVAEARPGPVPAPGSWDCDRAAGRARGADPDAPPPPDDERAGVLARTFTFDFPGPAPSSWYVSYAIHETPDGAAPTWRTSGVGHPDDLRFSTRRPGGPFRLVASVEADGVAFRPVVVEGWTPDGTTAPLRIRPGPRVSGRVVRADGTPVIGAKVEATWDAVGVSRRLWTDLDGRFALTGLDVATWRVEVSTPGLAATVALDVPESGIEDVRIVAARDR